MPCANQTTPNSTLSRSRRFRHTTASATLRKGDVSLRNPAGKSSMKFTLSSSNVVCIMLCKLWESFGSTELSSAMALPVLEEMSSALAGPSPITNNSACGEWASWVPPRTDPALVMQVVSTDYIDLERNFMQLMELNSVFTRHNMYLMCMDNASVEIFASLGIRCVPLSALQFNNIHDVWKTRVRALSCLVMEGYDVIMSDADALWLRDPMEYFDLPSVRSSSIVASRGSLPFSLSKKWGATLCLGFILFRASGPIMDEIQRSMQHLVSTIADDQITANRAVSQAGVTWDKESDMRLVDSTGLGRGTIKRLRGDDGPFVISLLPHSAFTRDCRSNPISNKTVVAHCHSRKKVGLRVAWMKEANLWLMDSTNPG